MKESVPKRSCKALNRRGEPCGRRAVTEGLCTVHSGAQNIRELGQLGGRARTRSVLGISDAMADDDLRGLARKQLEGLLTSENESVRLRAAASLFSYRATQPEQSEQEAPVETLTSVGRAWLRGCPSSVRRSSS